MALEDFNQDTGGTSQRRATRGDPWRNRPDRPQTTEEAEDSGAFALVLVFGAILVFIGIAIGAALTLL